MDSCTLQIKLEKNTDYFPIYVKTPIITCELFTFTLQSFCQIKSHDRKNKRKKFFNALQIKFFLEESFKI